MAFDAEKFLFRLYSIWAQEQGLELTYFKATKIDDNAQQGEPRKETKDA